MPERIKVILIVVYLCIEPSLQKAGLIRRITFREWKVPNIQEEENEKDVKKMKGKKTEKVSKSNTQRIPTFVL